MSLKFWGRPSYMWERARTVARWIPFLWKNDYDWDYISMLMILQFKLKCMKRSAETYWIVARADNDAKNMGICIEHIERLIEYDCMNNKETQDYHFDELARILKNQSRSWWD